MQKQTFRFNFSDSFNDLLETFSREHNNQDRKVFQSHWKVWKEENINIIEKEIQRIQENGYEGDVLQKMFTSARYYHRKKQTKPKPIPTTRKPYQSIPKSILNHMDKHIQEQIQKGNSPSNSFDDYCKEIQTLLNEQIENNTIQETRTILEKIKKSYKNRYQTK